MIVIGAAMIVLTAGCGSPGSHTYSLAKTTDCLKTKPVRLGGPLDFVATTATGGAVKIHTSDNFLTLVFGQTEDDANNIAAAYRRFAAKNVGVEDVLYQSSNAVLLWHKHWSQADLDLVTACLK
jgi:hypothetical protein